MTLVVGLGNPGARYRETRHNAGASLVETFAKRERAQWTKQKNGSLTADIVIRELPRILLSPGTYMNESGPAVAAAVKKARIAIEQLLVIYDDIDLPFGTFRISRNTSSGGHKGVQSIIDSLGAANFTRLRIGIGPQTGVAEDFVLERWSARERKELHTEIFSTLIEKLDLLLSQGYKAAAGTYK